MTSLFGYIEGYYGRMLSWEQRGRIVDQCASLKLNSYLYAPKEDPFHRMMWRTPYSTPWKKAFTALVKKGINAQVTVVPAMAPGLSFDYLSSSDYKILLGKLTSFVKCGCSTLALLMDDIPDALPANCTEAFSSLGQAHGYLLSRLLNDLRRLDSNIQLWFCPTLYADQLADGNALSSYYLPDLKATMPKGVPLFWTGPRVISPEISTKTVGHISRLFNNNIIIWDNLFANDYCPSRLFLGPLTGRAPDTKKIITGFMLNPTGMPCTDMLLLDLVASYRKGISPESAFKKACATHSVPEEFNLVAPFFASPFTQWSRTQLRALSTPEFKKALSYLVWTWKSDLHQEWYPFLYALETDLLMQEKLSAKGTQKKDSVAWIAKKYSPLIAHKLCG